MLTKELTRTVCADANDVAAAVGELVRVTCAAEPDVGILISRALPDAVYAAIGRALTSGVHVWFADERMVAPDDGESTYGQVQRAWKAAGVAQAALLHRIEGELGGIEGSRRATLELHIHAGAEPRFELAILGLDAEGNVAGLFPDDSGLRAGGFYFPARGGTHVTATVPLLSAARHLVYVAVGAAMAPVVKRTLGDPATITGEHVTWILDRESASQLT